MSRLIRLAIVAIALAGCGQKGALYLPPPDTAPVESGSASGADNQEEEQRQKEAEAP